MKKIFFLIAVLLAATCSFAQKFELGLNGGLVSHSVHTVYSAGGVQDFARFQTRITSPVVSLKGMYVTKHYQCGIRADYTILIYKSQDYPEMPHGLVTPISRQYRTREVLAALFVNRVFHFHKFAATAGFSAGYVFSNTSGKIIDPPSWGDGYMKLASQNTLTAALNVDATYFVTKRIGVNAELSGELCNYPTGPLDKNLIAFPVTLGVRYKL